MVKSIVGGADGDNLLCDAVVSDDEEIDGDEGYQDFSDHNDSGANEDDDFDEFYKSISD